MRKLFLSILLGCSIASLSIAASPKPHAAILVLGDSLSAAYHIAPESGWVTLLAQRLMQQNPQSQRAVVNASISGETSAGGLARLSALLAEHAPSVVVVELGANDGLRGLPIPTIRTNLTSIIQASRDAGAKVVLLGIELPVNYGPQYRTGLHDMYRDISAEFNAPLVPFLLDGVAQDPKLMQEDGLHPAAAGESRVLENIWPVLEPVLRSLR